MIAADREADSLRGTDEWWQTQWREIQRLLDIVAPGSERLPVGLTGTPPVLPPGSRPQLTLVDGGFEQ